MRDPRLLDYSPPRANALRRDLEDLRKLLWAVYTHRERSSAAYVYEGTGPIEYRQRHLHVAQTELAMQLKRIIQAGSTILIYISSFDDVVNWSGEVRRASVETTLIDTDDPNPPGGEIISAIVTMNAWLDELAIDTNWASYTSRYIRQNRLQLLLALLVGILSRILFNFASGLFPAVGLLVAGIVEGSVAEHRVCSGNLGSRPGAR